MTAAASGGGGSLGYETGATASLSLPVPMSGSIHAVVVDASVWVSRLVAQDSNHMAAVGWVNRHIRAGGTFVSPVLLAIKVAGAVRRRTGSSADFSSAVDALYTFGAMSLVSMDQALIAEATQLSSQPGLRGPDAVYVAVAKQLALPIVSFDTEQLTLPAHLIQTIRP